MSLREELISKVKSLPDDLLPEVLELISRFEGRKKTIVEKPKKTPGLLRRLQEIKIQGPPDFSRNFELYLNGEKKVEENLP